MEKKDRKKERKKERKEILCIGHLRLIRHA